METIITPYGAALAVSLVIGLLCYHGMNGKKPVVPALDLACAALPAGLAGARLLYVLFRPGAFLERGVLHIFFLREGGFLLYGAVLFTLCADALLARKKGLDMAECLDALSVPGLLTIALCRLSEGFAAEGLGNWVENESLWFFPVAIPNAYGEYQYALFVLEALAALGIALYLVRKHLPKGERIRSALLLYACCQVVLESLRMDSCLRMGFVHVSQVLSAVLILVIVLLRTAGKKDRRQLLMRVLAVLLITTAIGLIEFALEKSMIPNLVLYGLMILLCAGYAVLGMRKVQEQDPAETENQGGSR